LKGLCNTGSFDVIIELLQHTGADMLTSTQRRSMSEDIISAMRAHYEKTGEEGDFGDGLRYLANDASDNELQYEHDKWCKV
jgi:hypothetical protein